MIFSFFGLCFTMLQLDMQRPYMNKSQNFQVQKVQP